MCNTIITAVILRFEHHSSQLPQNRLAAIFNLLFTLLFVCLFYLFLNKSRILFQVILLNLAVSFINTNMITLLLCSHMQLFLTFVSRRNVFPSFLDVYVGVTHFHTEMSVEVTYVTSEQKHSESLPKVRICDFQIVTSLSSFSHLVKSKQKADPNSPQQIHSVIEEQIFNILGC